MQSYPMGGAKRAENGPTYLGGPPNDLEDSEDRRSAGGHGNQHVRLRCAQVTSSTRRSARLDGEPRQTSFRDFAAPDAKLLFRRDEKLRSPRWRDSHRANEFYRAILGSNSSTPARRRKPHQTRTLPLSPRLNLSVTFAGSLLGVRGLAAMFETGRAVWRNR
jgi:hypothetical protein